MSTMGVVYGLAPDALQVTGESSILSTSTTIPECRGSNLGMTVWRDKHLLWPIRSLARTLVFHTGKRGSKPL